MDTTEQYIKMSDCPEIFNECKFQGGDWFHVDGKSWMVYEFNEELSLEEHRKHFEGIVFLPRQDDIQKMGNWAISGLAQLIAEDLFPKRAEYLRQKFTSWEQILLAIYMYDEHSKIWSSKEEKWVKK